MKLKYTNTIRIAFQSVILGMIGYVALMPAFDKSYLADFEAYCPFGGLASLGSKLNQGTMSCNMSETQAFLGIGLIVSAIVLGKLFCSYICPIGAITEWIGKVGARFKIRIEIPSLVDKPLRSLKYALLFITLYYTMTTSELFCKEFDPYYASMTLFGSDDLVLYLAIPAFVITILGALFFRLFWCKYLCPLSAVSNIFLNVVIAGGLIIIFVIANVLGAEISYIWLVLGLVIIGLVNELGLMKSFVLPITKITRNTETCTDCGQCNIKCPQGIEISKYEKVNHIDCNLCTDCVYSCQTNNTLYINRSNKLKYLAPVATVIFIFISLGASSNFEFTTISERWGDFNSIDNVAVYEQTGLKNIKCYGSSKSLESQLVNIEGIYGLDTYAASHTVNIYYDPSEISETNVKKSLFTPMKQEVRKLKPNSLQSISIWEIGIYGLFDLTDHNNLFYLSKEDEGILGFETHFGEPVRVIIFYDDSKTNPTKILALFDKDFVMAKKQNGEEKVYLDFKAENNGEEKGQITIPEYTRRIFRTYDRKFNDYKKYDLDQLSIFIFSMPEAGVPTLRRYFASLTSHLSADKGIVRFSTRYTDKPYAYIFFDPNQTSVEKIKEALVKPILTVFVKTETKDIKNPFKIKPEGKVLNYFEANIDEDLQ